jgi:flagellar biosynthesis/type III secretory pathway protein FliH
VDALSDWSRDAPNRQWDLSNKVNQAADQVAKAKNIYDSRRIGSKNLQQLFNEGKRSLNQAIASIPNNDAKKAIHGVLRPAISIGSKQKEFKQTMRKSLNRAFNDAKNEALNKKYEAEAALPGVQYQAQNIMNSALNECTSFTSKDCRSLLNSAQALVEKYAQMAGADSTINFAKQQAGVLRGAAGL